MVRITVYVIATHHHTGTPHGPVPGRVRMENVRPTRIEASDMTAPMPISASTPHFTQAVKPPAKVCTPRRCRGVDRGGDLRRRHGRRPGAQHKQPRRGRARWSRPPAPALEVNTTGLVRGWMVAGCTRRGTSRAGAADPHGQVLRPRRRRRDRRSRPRAAGPRRAVGQARQHRAPVCRAAGDLRRPGGHPRRAERRRCRAGRLPHQGRRCRHRRRRDPRAALHRLGADGRRRGPTGGHRDDDRGPGHHRHHRG